MTLSIVIYKKVFSSSFLLKTLNIYDIMKRVCKSYYIAKLLLRGVILKRIRIVFIYFLVLFLICLSYFVESPLKELRIYEKAIQYFGITLLPALLFFVFYGFIFFCKDRIKRFVYEVKLYFFLVFVILVLYTYIIYKSGLDLTDLQNIILDDGYYRNLIEICIYRFRIGYVPTYILWLILNLKFSFQNIFYGMLLAQLVLFFLIVYAPIKNYIRDNYRAYKERKRLEREERLLYEQIKIKESLEKNETIRKIKFRENKEKLLEEKVEFFRKSTELKKMVNLNEDMGDES